jgi:hypothetical protein
MDGDQLYSDCVAAEHAATEYSRCVGYVMGIIDAAAAEENSSTRDNLILLAKSLDFDGARRQRYDWARWSTWSRSSSTITLSAVITPLPALSPRTANARPCP